MFILPVLSSSFLYRIHAENLEFSFDNFDIIGTAIAYAVNPPMKIMFAIKILYEKVYAVIVIYK